MDDEVKDLREEWVGEAEAEVEKEKSDSVT